MIFLFSVISVFLFFFFFQAEDGIRDIGVTGVQTCALPISPPDPPQMQIRLPSSTSATFTVRPPGGRRGARSPAARARARRGTAGRPAGAPAPRAGGAAAPGGGPRGRAGTAPLVQRLAAAAGRRPPPRAAAPAPVARRSAAHRRRWPPPRRAAARPPRAPSRPGRWSR